MSSEYFRCDDHVLEGSHIRGFPRTTSTNQEEVLELAIKQYTPLDNPNPKPGDITIIAAHANGFSKVHIGPDFLLSAQLLQHLFQCVLQ